MSKSQVQAGNVVDLTAPAGGVVSGGAYVQGALFAIAQTDAAAGQKYAGALCGVHELPKESTVAAFAEGEKVYWDAAEGRLDAHASGRYEVGTATEAADAGDAKVRVRLNAVAVTAEA